MYSSETAKSYGTEITVINCSFCGEEFDFWHQLGEHLSSEHESRVEQKEIRNRHYEGKHNPEMAHTYCNLCEKELEKKEEVQQSE